MFLYTWHWTLGAKCFNTDGYSSEIKCLVSGPLLGFNTKITTVLFVEAISRHTTSECKQQPMDICTIFVVTSYHVCKQQPTPTYITQQLHSSYIPLRTFHFSQAIMSWNSISVQMIIQKWTICSEQCTYCYHN